MKGDQPETSEPVVAQKPVVDFELVDPAKTHQVAKFKHKFPLTSCRVRSNRTICRCRCARFGHSCVGLENARVGLESEIQTNLKRSYELGQVI